MSPHALALSNARLSKTTVIDPTELQLPNRLTARVGTPVREWLPGPSRCAVLRDDNPHLLQVPDLLRASMDIAKKHVLVR